VTTWKDKASTTTFPVPNSCRSVGIVGGVGIGPGIEGIFIVGMFMVGIVGMAGIVDETVVMAIMMAFETSS